MNDMRRHMDATNKLNESPAGWAADKLTKMGQKAASKVTFGGAKSRLKQVTANREVAAKFMKIWDKKYAANKYQRIPQHILAFLKTELKMNDQMVKDAWNQTPEVVNQFGNYDAVTVDPPSQEEEPNQNRRPGGRAPKDTTHRIPSGLTAGPADRIESIEEGLWSDESGAAPKSIKLSADNFRMLLIKAIDVKNKATAQADLDKGEGPGDSDKDEPEQDPDDLKKSAAAGAKDMDGDGNYDWDDVAKQAAKRGETEKALDSIIDTIDPKMKDLVKSVLKGKVR